MPSTDLSELHPDLRPLYTKLTTDLLAQGITGRIIQGWRNPAYQDQLHAQGVSPLTGLTSKHCFMLGTTPASKAFDLGIFDGGTYVTDGNDPRYKFAGALWRQYGVAQPGLGIAWGGDFVHPRPDPDHFQIA